MDLAPLAGLARLQELDLNSSTGLGVDAVAAFQKSHPQTAVSRQSVNDGMTE